MDTGAPQYDFSQNPAEREIVIFVCISSILYITSRRF